MITTSYYINSRFTLVYFNNEYGCHIQSGYFIIDNDKKIVSEREKTKENIMIKFLTNNLKFRNNPEIINTITNQNKRSSNYGKNVFVL